MLLLVRSSLDGFPNGQKNVPSNIDLALFILPDIESAYFLVIFISVASSLGP